MNYSLVVFQEKMQKTISIQTSLEVLCKMNQQIYKMMCIAFPQAGICFRREGRTHFYTQFLETDQVALQLYNRLCLE